MFTVDVKQQHNNNNNFLLQGAVGSGGSAGNLHVLLIWIVVGQGPTLPALGSGGGGRGFNT